MYQYMLKSQNITLMFLSMSSFTDKKLFYTTDLKILWKSNFFSQKISEIILNSILRLDIFKEIAHLKFGWSLDQTEPFSKPVTNIW